MTLHTILTLTIARTTNCVNFSAFYLIPPKKYIFLNKSLSSASYHGWWWEIERRQFCPTHTNSFLRNLSKSSICEIFFKRIQIKKVKRNKKGTITMALLCQRFIVCFSHSTYLLVNEISRQFEHSAYFDLPYLSSLRGLISTMVFTSLFVSLT